jgi:hypothetical protein
VASCASKADLPFQSLQPWTDLMTMAFVEKQFLHRGSSFFFVVVNFFTSKTTKTLRAITKSLDIYLQGCKNNSVERK